MKSPVKSIYMLLLVVLCLSQYTVFAQAPGNDLICNAITLSVGSGCTQGTNVNATATGSPAAPACWNPVSTSNDVWYSFVATSSYMSVSTDFSGLTLNNTQVAVYRSSTNNCNGTLTLLACSENSGTNVANNSIIDTTFVPGNTYFIRIDGNGTATGTFCINVADTYVPGSTPCEAQHITPNNKPCVLNSFGVPDGGNYVFNSTNPAAAYSQLGVDYGGCDNETAQYGTWNVFTANSTSVTLTNMETTQREYTLFSGPCNNLSWISCTSVAGNGTTTFSGLTLGTEYYLLTTLPSSATTQNFQTDLCLSNTVGCTAPTNDNCSNAAPITANVLYYVSSYCATADNPPNLCSGGIQNNIWFTWTTPANWTGQAFFQIFSQNCRGGDRATGMQCSVYAAGVTCGTNSTNCVTISNTGVDNNINTVWTPTPGATYLIQYDGNGGEVCEMNFQITNSVSPVVVSVNSPTICQGDSVVLTATSNATGYLWSTGQTGSSITVSPSTTTTYSVSATAGGTGSAISTVTVNPIPAAPTAGSNSPICAGSTLNLTASTIANATYSWTGPNGFTSSVQNPSITSATAAAAGTYQVTATVLNCTSAPATTAVVVNPVPSAPVVSSNSPVCTGGTIQLTADSVSGATYSWTGPGGFTSSLQNPTIANAGNANAGTYSLTVSVLGCVSPAATTTVILSPVPSAPVAGSNSPVCTGGTINLFVNTIAGATYSWTGPNGFTSTDQNPSILNADSTRAGVYSVVANISGCNSAVGSTTVVINPIPDAPIVSSNSPVCEGQTLQLTAQSVQGGTYSWTGPNGFTSNLQNPSFPNADVTLAGNYTATVTVGGCQSAPATTTVVVNKTPTPTATSNSPICEGATLSFTVTTYGSATYTWTGPNGFTSTDQNPTIPNATTAASGTYSVYVTSSGCGANGPVSVNVTVTAIPAPVASNNGPLCSGATLNLTSTSIPGATYSWTGPNGYTSNLQNPTIPGATTGEAGVYSVVANVSGCNSSNAGSTTVVINPIPVTTAANNGPLCAGATLNLTATTFAGATYTWSGPNGFTSTQQNPSITGVTTANAGTYSVTVTAAGCTSSAPASTTVVIGATPATPAASSNSPLCVGATLVLTASNVPGADYQWTGPNGFTSADQNPVINNVTLADAGVYTVRAFIDGCTSAPATANVIVRPIPASPVAGSNSPVCVGQPINLTATTVAGATYTWTGPNGFTSSIQNPGIPSATVADSGLFSVTATVSGCTSPAATTNVIVTPLPPAPIAGSNSPVCLGDTLFLTASFIPGASYLWTDPIGFTSTEQNPVVPNVTALAAATYTVVATVNGCTGPGSQVTVVVVPRPTATFTSNAPVCLGVPVNFTNTGSTGNGFTYSWEFGSDATPTSSTLENPTGILYGTQGTKTVIFTVGNGSCATTDTQTISVTGIPFADFNNDGPACAAPGVITFTDNSTGNVTSWLWDFGPNAVPATSTSSGPVSVTFNTNGTHMVMLTVSGGGCSNTTTKTVDVGVVGADFTSSVPQNGANGCLGQPVNFYNIGSSGSGATHFWNFGAGATPATSTDENPTNIIYASTGAKIVTHTVSVAGCGLDSTVQHIVTINPIPTTSFTTTAPVCANTSVNFTNTGSTGVNYSYFWDFGAGASPSTSVAESPQGVTYSSSGTKTVTLTITNEFYCVVAATQNITIFSTPTASFSTNAPTCTLLPVNFTNTGTTTGVTWAWDFGADALPVNSTDQNPTGITYAVPGIKPISLTTTDINSGCSNTYSQSITINQSPYASFTSNAPQCGNVPFNFTNTGSTGGSWSYTWNFGAGASPAISSAENPLGVLYSSAGTKTVTLTVSGQGCTQTSTQSIVVDEAPVADFATTAPSCTGLGVDFTNTGTSSGVSYSWNFGSGATPATSTDANPTGVVYSTAGSKVVTLVVTNTISGCSDTKTLSFNIGQSPVASFTSTAPQCATSAIDFTNTGSTGSNWAYSWNFGVGASPSSSSAENPSSIQYSSSGTKTVTLTVTGGGCTQTATQSIVISATPTVGIYTNAPQCTGVPVNFANTGSGTNVTWSWNFGSGATPATSNDQHPQNIVYSTAGFKNVSLTITDTTSGCSVTEAIPITIFQSPTASFTSTAPQCTTVGIDFTNTGSTGSNWSYSWTFGQGSIPAFSTAENPVGVSYVSAGTKTVTFTISDQHCTQTATQSIVIDATPTAGIATTAPQCTGVPVDFTASGTSTGVSWSWDFGLGSNPPSTTDQNPLGVIYNTAGVKSVSLIVTDTLTGCSVQSTVIINIYQSPTASFTSTAPQCSSVGIDFTNTGTTGANWYYAWNFGQDAVPAFGSGENPTGIRYTTSGTKTVTFTVSDQHCSSTVAQNIVINATPTATFTSNAPRCTGLAVDFTNFGSTNNVVWSWNFGADATPATSTSQNASGVVYSTGGTKVVTLTATDTTSGCAVTATNTITIHQTPTATFTSNAPQCATVGINFTNTGSTGSNWSYSWNLGVGANPPVSAAESPSGVMYNSDGTKTVTFTIADQYCTQTTTQQITILATPVSAFTSTAPECTGLPIDFTNLGSSANVSWSWNFGNSATPPTSTDANPTGVVYATPGTKTVTLTTSDITSGCSVTTSATINIRQTPTASFTSTAPQCAGVGISFTNTGSNGANWSYSWDFGVGAVPSTATTQNPTGVVYSSSGPKTVTFTVSDQNCSQTFTQAITISETPVSNFTSTAPQCTGLPVNFNNLGTSTDVTWNWNFGPGASPATSIVENPSGVIYQTAGIKNVVFTITNVTTNCSVTASSSIVIYQTPTASFTSTAPQCANRPVIFTNTGTSGSNWTYNWDFGTDATPAVSVSENPSGIVYASSGAKTVTFTISDANCTNTTTQTISVSPLPYAEAGADTTICANRSVVLGGDSATAGATYNWFPSNTLDNPFAANPIARPTASVTTYSVTVTAPGSGCVNTDFVTITMLSPLNANAGPDVNICYSDSVQIGAGFIEGQFYHWTPELGLSDANSSNPIANPAVTTTYTLVVTDTVGCDAITDNVTVIVNPLPTADAGADDTINTGGTVQLVGTGGVQYVWTPAAGLSNANLYNPIASPDSTTTYVLTVTDLFGCRNTDTVRITVISYEKPWWIPTSFTPDGNGHNDILYVRGGGFLTFEFSIYNRYGELLFLSKDINKGWDGLSMTGGDIPPDAYVYKIAGVLNDGTKVDEKGLVNLVK